MAAKSWSPRLVQRQNASNRTAIGNYMENPSSQGGGFFYGDRGRTSTYEDVAPPTFIVCYNICMENHQISNNKEYQFTKKDIHAGDITAHLERINREYRDGFAMLKKYPRSVTIFGSSQIPQDHPVCIQAKSIAGKIARELKYAVLTGGGPGVMEAANRGAKEAGGDSIGLNVSLRREATPNGFTTDHMKFAYFFSRKTMLTFAAEAYIFMPGGYGTFDELFIILTLIQTEKIPKVPVILFDSKFWHPIMTILQHVMQERYKTIEAGDLELCTVTDSQYEVIKIISKAPVSRWWRNIN